jgi:hypothetical protein
MINSEVIDKIHEFRESTLEKIQNQDVISFKVNDIEFDDNLVVNNSTISDKALKKIFNTLRVHNDFFVTYKKALDIDSWEDIKYNLKRVKKDNEFYGKKIIDSKGNHIISDLYKKNEIINEFSIYDRFDNNFRFIEDALEQSEIPYEIKELSYIENDENVIIKLLNKDGKIDVFNDDLDVWKKGLDFNWDSFNFASNPHLERLICSNGMVTRKYGFNTNIQKKSFDASKIENIIYKNIINSNDKIDDIIKEYCNHLKNVNISVSEFKQYKDFFIDKNNEEKYDHILNSNVFNDDDIFKAYGDITKKSNKWLTTADSGRNAYDFFNNLTALSSHNKHFNIEKQDAVELQIKTSDLFFKEELDLEDVAPKITFKVENPFPDNYIFTN